jgi:acyl CoA:acetate/3-ketoacid CoA transferase beta subunit
MIWLQKQILTILGAMEVSTGILLIGKPGKMVKGTWCWMILVAFTSSAMMHSTKQENLKSPKMYAAINCVGCVKKVVTELVVLEVTQNGL